MTPDSSEVPGSTEVPDFTEVFREIRAGAVARELDRTLAVDAVAALTAAGFGALRVPVEFGGAGLSLPALLDLLVDLAAADSNVAHLLRGHFAFVEILLLRPASEYRDGWLRAVVAGAIVGNAASETSGTSLADISTTLTEVDGAYRLDGRKFYSTGTLYGSHVYVAAAHRGERVTVVVETDAPGVTVHDDWDGVGQRLTASGTTEFEGVEVDPRTIARYADGGASHLGGFFQLVLVAVAAGVARAVLDDAVDFVRPRTRTYITANTPAPRDDPQVQHVIGQLSATAFSCRALVAAAAASMQRAVDSHEPGAGQDALLVDTAEIAAYQAQVTVLADALTASTLLFEVGGASATFRTAALDRHWRNARTIASHNPAIYKSRQIGEWELSGTSPNAEWRKLWSVGPRAV